MSSEKRRSTMPEWGRRARAAATVSMAVGLAFALSACGPRGGLSDRYVAERLAWRAQTLSRAMAENPDMATDEMKARLRSVYEEIVSTFPPPAGPEPSDIEMDVARISGMSRLRLASMLQLAGESDAARDLYASVVGSYAFSRTMCIEASSRLATSLEEAGEFEEAARVLWDMAERWPPAPAGETSPDPRVLGAPTRAAANLVASGVATPQEAMDRVRQYYRRQLDEWKGTPVAAAALRSLAESYQASGSWSDAIAAYERLDREYGTDDNRASIWVKLGDLYSSGKGDNAKASEYYRKVESRYASRPEGGAAAISLARFDMGARRYEEARKRLESVVSRFPDEEALAATAIQHIAMSYELEGKPEAAIARYGVLAASYGTSLYGMAAPLRVAEIYDELGERDASRAAAQRAAQQYERIIRDYAGTPAELAARNYLITVKTRLEEWPRVAELLLETASMKPDDPASISMMFQAARIYADDLSDSAAAQEVLRGIASRYEGTPAGEEALRRLEQFSG